MPDLVVTFPPESAPGDRWTPELAASAVGRPFTSRPGGTVIGYVSTAEAQPDGSLRIGLHANGIGCWVGDSVKELSIAPRPSTPRA